MKWDETASHGKEATLTMEIEWKQIEGCITSDDAEIGIPTCIPLALVVREPLPGERERECHNTLHVLDLHLDFSSTLARQISGLI